MVPAKDPAGMTFVAPVDFSKVPFGALPLAAGQHSYYGAPVNVFKQASLNNDGFKTMNVPPEATNRSRFS
jgi:hypothetical protein